MNLSDAKLGDEVVVYIGNVYPVSGYTDKTDVCTIIGIHQKAKSWILGSKSPKFGYERASGLRRRAEGYNYIENDSDFNRSYLVNDLTIDSIIGQSSNANVISSSPINDHTCAMCKNDRCSKTEKSCWRCGALIK